MIGILQGRDEEQGFSGPNKEQVEGKGRQRQGRSVTGDSCRVERPKERGLAGGCLGLIHR
jgi:hypothetical protein